VDESHLVAPGNALQGASDVFGEDLAGSLARHRLLQGGRLAEDETMRRILLTYAAEPTS